MFKWQSVHLEIVFKLAFSLFYALFESLRECFKKKIYFKSDLAYFYTYCGFHFILFLSKSHYFAVWLDQTCIIWWHYPIIKASNAFVKKANNTTFNIYIIMARLLWILVNSIEKKKYYSWIKNLEFNFRLHQKSMGILI